jgi:hypothetical protein
MANTGVGIRTCIIVPDYGNWQLECISISPPPEGKHLEESHWELIFNTSNITKQLETNWLQILWPEDGRWWPCQVSLLDVGMMPATVLYQI